MTSFLRYCARHLVIFAGLAFSPLVIAQGYVALNYDTLFYEQPNVEIAGQGEDNPPFIIIRPDPATGGFEREERFRDLDLTLQSLRFKFGYSIFSWLAVEGRASIGASKRTLNNFRERPIGAIPLQIPNPDFGMPGEPQFLNGVQVTIRQADSEITMKRHFGSYLRLGGNFDSLVSPYLVWGRSKAVCTNALRSV